MEPESTFVLSGKIWINGGGERLLGSGRVELLERIHASGSIRQAALQMKMSYKQAWDLIKDMNLRFDAPVVASQRGGKGGGVAAVTDKGFHVIRRYHALNEEFQKFLEERQSCLDL